MPSSPTSNKRKRTTPIVEIPAAKQRHITPDRIKKADIKVQIPITPPASLPSSSKSRSARDKAAEEAEEQGGNMRFTTNMNGVQLLASEEDTGSPRTKVAYHFQGLQLEDGGEVGKLSLDSARPSLDKLVARTDNTPTTNNLDESAVRKRLKVLSRSKGSSESKSEIPETPFLGKTANFGIAFGPERTIDPIIENRARQVTLQNEIDPAIFNNSPNPRSKSKSASLARAYPSINRLSDSKSRSNGPKLTRKETYPLFGSADASVEIQQEVTDQARAELTWHENEITGHNPSDPEDDGEGINGIGFRPTAAEAYQRGVRRKQQMAEYKSREAKEARARRSENRRKDEADRRSLEEKEVARRVRFMEAEKEAVIIDM